jgi:hypothetical protein
MKRRPWWNPKISPISLCVALLIMHAILKELLSRYDVVSCILAAGGHVPMWMFVCAVAFVLIRLSVFLLIPAILAWRVTTALAGRIFCRTKF